MKKVFGGDLKLEAQIMLKNLLEKCMEEELNINVSLPSLKILFLEVHPFFYLVKRNLHNLFYTTTLSEES
jgi:hypothetical protein